MTGYWKIAAAVSYRSGPTKILLPEHRTFARMSALKWAERDSRLGWLYLD